MLLRPAAGGPGAAGPADPGGTTATAYDAAVEAAAEAGRFFLRRVLAPGALGDPNYDTPEGDNQAADPRIGGEIGGAAAAAGAVAATAMSPEKEAQMKKIIDWYSIGGDVMCLLSLLAGLAVIYKLAKRPQGFMRGRAATHGPHSMKRFMDQVVMLMSCIDTLFAAVLIITLTTTWRLWYFQGVANHWVWWAFAQFCWLPQFYHCYIASVCFNWVVRKHSVNRLQRNFPRAVALVLAAVAIQSTVALCLNYLDVRSGTHDTSAKTVAYVEYLVVHVATQLCILCFYAGTCWSLVGHLRGGHKVNRPYRKIVWRFIKMCAMSLVVWNFWTAVMVMWYLVFETQLVLIMLLTLPTFSYPFLDAWLMGNVFELYKRGPSSEEARRQQQGGPVTIASTSVKCLESRTGAYHRQSGRSSTNLLGHPRAEGPRTARVGGGSGAGGATVFTTTLNLGEVKDIRKLGGSLDEWVPPDYDVYCVGVQECAILQDLRAALHAHLGGPEHYTMFTAEIGAANLLFGTIALTAFARTREVESGAFARIDAAAGSLRNGVNLVVTKTANKGMVGMAFRYHDATLGFVTAHFASDSNGKKRLRKRNEDAYQMLRSLCLTDTEEGFDFHLELHHTFVMGDLNYRITRLDAQGMVERTAQAARQAARILHHQSALDPATEQPAQQWAGSALGLPMPLGLAIEHAAQADAAPAREDSGRNVHFGLPDEPRPERSTRGVSFSEPASPPSPPAAGAGRISWVRERYLRLFPHVPSQTSSYGMGRNDSSRLGSVAVDVAAEEEEEETKAAGGEHSPPTGAAATAATAEEEEGVEMEMGPVGLALHRRWSGLTTEQEQRQRRRLHPHPLALGESSSSFISVADGDAKTPPPLSPSRAAAEGQGQVDVEVEELEEMEPDSDEEEDEETAGEGDDGTEGDEAAPSDEEEESEGSDEEEEEEEENGRRRQQQQQQLDSSSSPLVVVPAIDEPEGMAAFASEATAGGNNKARQWLRQSIKGMQEWLSTSALAPGSSGGSGGAAQGGPSSSRRRRSKKSKRKRKGGRCQPGQSSSRRFAHLQGLSEITELSGDGAEEEENPSSAASTSSGNSVYVPKRGAGGKKRPHSSSSSGSSSSANDVFVSGSSSTSAAAAGGSNHSLDSAIAAGAVPPTITAAISRVPEKEEGVMAAGTGVGMPRGRSRRSTRRLPSDRRLATMPPPGERPRVAHAWQWVNEIDELQTEMRAGRAFHGFSEGEIAFPPSFRWRRGAVAGDFSDPARLAASYVLQKKGDGQRVPSYTDRILFHSLADVRGNLTLVAYEMADTITGSDHRPVSAAFELQLNKKVIGFRTLRDDPAHPAAAAATNQRSSPPGSPRGPASPPPALRQVTPAADYPTASVWSVTLSHVMYTPKDAAAGAPVSSSSPASSSSAGATSSSASSNRGEHSGSGSGNGSSSNVKPALTPNADWSLSINFPSLLEDPFAHDRQMRLLEEAMEGGSSAAAAARQAALVAQQQQQQQQAVTPKSAPVTGTRNGGASTLGRSLSLALPLPHWGSGSQISDLPALPAGMHQSVLGAAFGQAAALTTRAHQAAWAQASGASGTSFKVLVLPEISRHALVKVTDSKGVEVGQGVICLRHAFPTASRSSRTGAVQVIRRLVRGHAADERRLEIPLSLGGRAAGTLSLRIGIHRREYAYEFVRPDIALRTPVPPRRFPSVSPKLMPEPGPEPDEEEKLEPRRAVSTRRVNFEETPASPVFVEAGVAGGSR